MFLKTFNQFFTLYLVFPSIILLGLFLTWKLRFVQVRKLKQSFAHVFKRTEKGEEGNISHYQAVSSVLASNFGTGNIAGMAIALAVGGPGALVWMWIMTFFGSAIQYANCLLGVKYRQKNSVGEYVGGPMYYLTKGLGLKKLAMLFSGVVIFAAFACGNLVQVNSMALPLAALGIAPWVTGLVLAFFVGIVVIGGAHRVANVSSAVVPIMAILYMGAALVILGMNAGAVPSAFILMIKSAFSGFSVAGGVAGFSIMRALTAGFDRAIFATDAGTGTVPILQSGAKTKNPVDDGVVSLLAPFFVMIVCTTTALVLIVTGAFTTPGLESTNMVIHAFQGGVGIVAGRGIVITALLLFGYTTTLAWATCIERAAEFIGGRRLIRPLQLLYILVVPLGALLHVSLVWILADIALTSMMVINLIGVAGLSKEVIADTRAYEEESPSEIQVSRMVASSSGLERKGK